jgi:Flp pilus assembly protein TadG
MGLVTYGEGFDMYRAARKFASFFWKTPFWRSVARDTRGQELAEAAVVLPLMFMILLGIFWFGQAFRIYGTLAQAARQGARAAVAPVCTTCAAGNTAGQNAYNAIQNTFAAAHLDIRKLSQPTTIPVLKSCVSGAAVGCDASPSNVCVQEPVVLSSTTGTTAAGVCGVSVSFQYPYQFWFPGTSLNNQLIQLQGNAEMRSETH